MLDSKEEEDRTCIPLGTAPEADAGIRLYSQVFYPLRFLQRWGSSDPDTWGKIISNRQGYRQIMGARPEQQPFRMGSKVRLRKPVSIREKVRDAIRKEIYAGRIKAGSRLIEAQLAKQINTSRTPVREALHTLEMEGLLESIPRVGYRVKPLDWSELEELCEIRAVNETLAAQWAMERATPGELSALEQHLVLSEKEGASPSFWESDEQFHERIALCSNSRRLLDLCGQLRRHMRRYRLQTLQLSNGSLHEVSGRSNTGHWNILNAIKNRDRTGVEKAVRDHLEAAKQDILRYALKHKKG